MRTSDQEITTPVREHTRGIILTIFWFVLGYKTDNEWKQLRFHVSLWGEWSEGVTIPTLKLSSLPHSVAEVVEAFDDQFRKWTSDDRTGIEISTIEKRKTIKSTSSYFESFPVILPLTEEEHDLANMLMAALHPYQQGPSVFREILDSLGRSIENLKEIRDSLRTQHY